MKHILAIDVGSSSARLIVYRYAESSLKALFALSAPIAFHTDSSGASEIAAESLRAVIERLLDSLCSRPDLPSLNAVCMATFVGNLLGVDESGRPLTPIYTYADTRCAPQVEMLRAELGEAGLRESHRRVGCMLHTAYHAPKLLWLHERGVRAASWTDFATYLYRAWFGRADVPCSYSVASWSGIFNGVTFSWDAPWLDRLGIRADQLPPLADYSAAQRGLSPEYAARWQALRDIPFFLAVGDGAAANIGSGAAAHGETALTIGTTAAIRTISTESAPDLPFGAWRYRVDGQRHLIGGATSEGGNIFQWVREQFRLPETNALEQALLERAPDAHGLTFLPMLGGERAPNWNPSALGTLHGIRLSTTGIDVLRAALEGVALRLAAIARLLGLSESPIWAGGGALHSSRAWAQLMADALNAPLRLVAENEPTARGAALMALAALGEIALTDLPPQIEATIVPRPEGVRALQVALKRHEALYQALYG
ncbi:MAG: carbohydrate kinase [Candidatus Thermofonsia Clade 1 bacterium]|uniref:Carbohydrate kinase n=2 Tax=Candidatus Thermofonsia Clade 1 bacterium TaxID=2364210 RepID=A0A2M8P222_9CHLR|nr:MAG: carbohydrate kinase [Candidatus Thermofonsia Clade 1 bacterium]